MIKYLYRGKRKDNGQWVIGHLIWYEDGRARITPRHTDIYCLEEDENVIQHIAYEVIPETVGQFTGLTDKNDIRIFDGHIVKLYLEDTIETGIIRYSESKSRFVLEANDTSYGFDDTCIFEIIGNIEYKSELLEEKQ